MSPASLSSLKNTLIQEILENIDNPRHLVAFAATSQRFCDLVTTSHIVYWKIRCDPRRKLLWTELSESPVLAARVRILELVAEDEDTSIEMLMPSYTMQDHATQHNEDSGDEEVNFDENLCSWGHKNQLLECMAALAKALQRTKRLFRFCWSFWPASDVGFNTVFESLQHNCPLLRELQVEYSQENLRQYPSFYRISTPLWKVSELTSLSLVIVEQLPRTHHQPQYLDPLMIILLTRCPNLEQLFLCLKASVDGSRPIQASRLLAAKWPHLKRLSLSGHLKLYKEDVDKRPKTRAALLKRFLKSHPKIEAISLNHEWLSPVPGGIFSSDTTPNLRSLSLLPDRDRGSIQGIISSELAGKITHFSGALTVDCLSLLSEMKALCSLCLINPANYSLLDVAYCVPDLQGLSVYIPSTSCCTHTILDMLPHLVHLSRFKRITHLAWLFNHVDTTTLEAEGLLILTAASIPSLIYIQVAGNYTDDTDTGWIKLRRDASGLYNGFISVQDAERQELQLWTWGDYFTGFVPH
ncbi:hypothetical protein BU17DRAFT_86872 [Hysterangium stoloniferum]|nr:hypothetical protein BU17DRAFT_86872 [Hysterangium stoloniferum]